MTSRIRWLRVRNWEHWQSYRKDRGPPPWIKLHRRLLQDMDWSMLSDAEKGHLVSIWILAADRDGMVPGDPRALQRVLGLDAEPDLAKFKELGLLEAPDGQDDVNVTSEWRQGDAPEQSRGEEETEAEAEQSRAEPSSAPAGAPAKPNGHGGNGSSTVHFDAFWAVYPVKRAKKRCRDIWARKRLDQQAERIIHDVRERQRLDRRWLDGYVPNPATYLNQERWEDEFGQPEQQSGGVQSGVRQWLEQTTGGDNAG